MNCLVCGNLVVLDQPDVEFRGRQRQATPVIGDLRPHGSRCPERVVLRVQQLLASDKELTLGVERLGRMGLLLRREGLLVPSQVNWTRQAAMEIRPND